MPKNLTSLGSTTQFFATILRPGWQKLLLLTLMVTAVEVGSNLHRVQASPPPQLFGAAPSTAPQSLQNTLAQVDVAANQRDIKAVMRFYGPNFTHSDGLTRQTLEQTLSELWQGYSRLNYQTQLQSWQADGNGFVVETVTNITGVARSQNRDLALKAAIRSRQRIVNQKILRQDVVSERSQVTFGAKPPKVQLRLPLQVQVGQQYNLDAIVTEPLGDSLLLGAALEEPVSAKNYLGSGAVKLEALSAGGIFKVGKAPAKATSQWVSVVLIQEGGMTQVSQRLQFVNRLTPKRSATPQSVVTR